jgi:hypothetical protein
MMVTSPEVTQLDPLSLQVMAEAVRRKERRFSEMIGMHLGTLLKREVLKDVFVPDKPKNYESPEDEDKPQISDNFYMPLILAIRPEVREHLKGQAAALAELDMAKKMSETPPKEVSVLTDLDEAEREFLEAVSKVARTQAEKAKAEAQKRVQEGLTQEEIAAGVRGIRRE